LKQPLIKSFWESRTLFSKRVLAAGGKSGGGFEFFYLFSYNSPMKPLGKWNLYAAQTGGVDSHSFQGEGAAS
jgi:hypothetical protein